MKYLIECAEENAQKFWDWICHRGGLAKWRSADLSCASKTWTTPALTVEGRPTERQGWQMRDDPEIVTDPTLVEVFTSKAVKRFRVGLRMGGNGMSLKCTDAASARIHREVEKAGDGAFYVFDYDTQEAVIMATDNSMSLAAYAAKKGWVQDEQKHE